MQTIPVFVVSLPDCTDRRKAISQSLQTLGIAFEFVDAVDGRHGLDPQYEDQIDRVGAHRAGYILSDAEFGCALSHIHLYRRIVADNLAYALILEDDARPSPKLVEFLAGRHYHEADLIQLYCARPYVRWTGAQELFYPYTSYLRTPRLQAAGCVAYTISYTAAFHFMTHAVPVMKEADWPLCIEALIAKRQSRVIYPSLVGHPTREETDSILNRYGRKENRNQRRFFGMYIPPFRRMMKSWGRAPYKLLAKRLP